MSSTRKPCAVVRRSRGCWMAAATGPVSSLAAGPRFFAFGDFDTFGDALGAMG